MLFHELFKAFYTCYFYFSQQWYMTDTSTTFIMKKAEA